MPKNDDLFGKNEPAEKTQLIDATDPESVQSSPSSSISHEHAQGEIPPLDTTQADPALDADKAPAESPANPNIEQDPKPELTPPEPQGSGEDAGGSDAPSVPGKLPDHGTQNENEDVVKDATQKQYIHQALVYALRTAKELAANVKNADTKYSQVATELDSFLAGFTGKVESVQSDVPQAAGADAAHGDPAARSHFKI